MGNIGEKVSQMVVFGGGLSKYFVILLLVKPLSIGLELRDTEKWDRLTYEALYYWLAVLHH